MSLYGLLFGSNNNSEALLKFINCDEDDFGRFRDVFVEDNHIVVHTRCGGGNREDYEHIFETMQNHPWYSHDRDCDYDYTYANIYFKIPDDQINNFNDLLKTFEQTENVKETPDKKWENLFEEMRRNK